jgi:hypothetical protein
MDKLNLRTEAVGNLIIETYHVMDLDARFDQYADPSSDDSRYESWQADEWYFIGVCVDIRIKTATNWAVPSIVGRASIWGVESDSGADYFAELEKEMRADAFADLRRTYDALRECDAIKRTRATV